MMPLSGRDGGKMSTDHVVPRRSRQVTIALRCKYSRLKGSVRGGYAVLYNPDEENSDHYLSPDQALRLADWLREAADELYERHEDVMRQIRRTITEEMDL